MKFLRIIVGVLIVLLVSFLFFRMSSEPSGTSIDGTDVSFESRDVPAGMRLYQNAPYRFSLLYPEALEMHEKEEGAGASTMLFQDTNTGQGFQIFIVPYTETQVTPDRIAKDIPSGVVKDTRDITIDGATAASFYSQNVTLGETAEIWFVHGGFLYEVTTLAPLDDWLSQIMLTWRFE